MTEDQAPPSVYTDVLDTISARERSAEVSARQWQGAVLCMGLIATCAILLAGYALWRSDRKYVLVSETAEGRLRIVHLPDHGWNPTELQIRNTLSEWIRDVREFGTDDIAISAHRLRAWRRAKKPAQLWLTGWYSAWPADQTRKRALEIPERIRFVPPTSGRTWEAYWEEQWTTGPSGVKEVKPWRALLTITIEEPTTDAMAEHYGVFVETIRLEERVSAQ